MRPPAWIACVVAAVVGACVTQEPSRSGPYVEPEPAAERVAETSLRPVAAPTTAAAVAPPAAAPDEECDGVPVEAPVAVTGGPCDEGGPHDAPPPVSMAAAPRERVAFDGPRLGPVSAPVTIVFAADLECDFCAQAWATLGELRTTYGDRLAVVYAHHPLPMHLHAVDAGVALEAAGEQGAFWQMADLLFARQDHLERADLVEAARHLGLDLRAFEAALDAPGPRARVQADRARMDELDVRGAPTFWIDGRRLVGAYPLATFRALIDEELESLAAR